MTRNNDKRIVMKSAAKYAAGMIAVVVILHVIDKTYPE